MFCILTLAVFGRSTETREQLNMSENTILRERLIRVASGDKAAFSEVYDLTRTYVFVGLERTGGVMIYDISNPSDAAFVNYFNSRDYYADIKDDVSPEGVAFAAADENSSGVPVLIISNEVSGTVSVMAIEADTAEKNPDKPQEPSNETEKPTSEVTVSPKTGDTGIGIVTLALSSGVLVGAAVTHKKKKSVEAE